MSTNTGDSERAHAAKQRVEEGLEALRVGLAPYVAKHMRDRHGPNWRHYASRAHRDESGGDLDVYALLKTLLDQWNDLFRHDTKLRKARSFVSLALDARNSAAHFAGDMGARETLRYLDAMRELLAAVGATPQVEIIEGLYEAERAASGGQTAAAPAALALEEPPPPERLRPWREVCEPHPDVLEARFSDAEFAANLALVDQGDGGEEYGDPAAFFRITYATEGLRRVLTATVARHAGRGDEQGRDALRRLEKIFGRVQFAWTPASGIETFEIVRRPLFQPLDEAGMKAPDDTVRAFRRLYRENRADFPAETREAAYEEQMRRAYPLLPEVLRRFSGDWSVLEKLQRTRGVLKIMANAVYALCSDESAAPLATPALLPFRGNKVRTALLEPLDRAFGPILQSEVDGEQSLTARIEAQRPRLLRARAATLAAREVFFATAPHAGAARGAMAGTDLRLACAQPRDQIAMLACKSIRSGRVWRSPHHGRPAGRADPRAGKHAAPAFGNRRCRWRWRVPGGRRRYGTGQRA